MKINLCNQDTLSVAEKFSGNPGADERPVLVLNFANPRRPSGGIRETSITQNVSIRFQDLTPSHPRRLYAQQPGGVLSRSADDGAKLA